MTDKDETRQKIAVALQYELGRDAAPRVTAKGKGEVAEKIVEIAQGAGVHVEHNKPLAQSLSQLELDQQIPKGALQGCRRSHRFRLETRRGPRTPQDGFDVKDAEGVSKLR